MRYFRSGLDAFRRVQISESAWALLIVLLAFALRVYRLGAQAIWWDESLSVYRATHDLGTILANTILIQNVVTHDLQPPLYFFILHFLVGAFGLSEYALRILSVFANVATVPLLYALARRWLAPSAGALAALLGALSPFYVWYAQEARPYALVLFWSLLAVYALTRAFDFGRGSARTNADAETNTHVHTYPGGRRQILRSSASNLWIIVYVLTTAAALYTNYYAVFLIPFHAALIAFLIRRTPHARPFILLPAIPSAAAVFLVPVALQAARENVASGPGYVPFDVILRDLLNSFSVGITVDLAQVVSIDVVLFVLFVVGLVAFRRAAIFLLAFLAIPLVGLAAASFIRPLYQNSRYFISLSPAFYLGVAAGIVAFAQRWKMLAVPALGVFLIGAVLSLNNWYFNPSFGKDDHRAWAEYLREHIRPGDFLILDSPHTEELYHYYADDIVPMTTLPILRADHVESPAQDLAAVRHAYQSNTRVWFLSMHTPFDDPQQRIQKDLGENGTLIDKTDFRGTSTEIALSLFLPQFPTAQANEIEHPLNVEFAGHLHLRGFAVPAVVKPGERCTVILYWQIDEPVGEDYAVSIRLVNSSGARVGQWDTTPLGNRAGSSTWQPNEIVADAQDMATAVNTPPGTYQLRVVPYHSATGNPLGDVVTLGDIQIERNTAP